MCAARLLPVEYPLFVIPLRIVNPLKSHQSFKRRCVEVVVALQLEGQAQLRLPHEHFLLESVVLNVAQRLYRGLHLLSTKRVRRKQRLVESLV